MLLPSETALLQAGIFSLIASLFLYVTRSILRENRWVREAAWTFLALSVLCFGGSLYQRSQLAGYFALSNMYESLLVVSMWIQIAFLVLDRKYKLPAMGWVVTLLVFTSVAYATTLPTDIKPLQAALVSYWRSIHVPVILSSYALFTTSFVSSVMSLWSGRNMISAAGSGGTATLGDSGFGSGPTLYDEITYRCVSLGFPLLVIGIILGGLWANEAWGNYWSWDPKESMSLVTLLGYGVYLHMRINGEHSSRTLSWVSVAGFILLLVTYFGVNLMGVGLHSYGKIG